MFKVSSEKCIGCTKCIKDCPANDIFLNNGKATIKNENCLKCGHCIAICPVNAVSTDEYNMDEVKEYNEESFKIDSNNLLNFIKFRRSVRKFKNKEVEKEKIEKIIEAGRFTQTAKNDQDVSYIVVDKNLKKLKELTYKSLKEKGEYLLNNLTPETEHLKRYALMWSKMYENYKLDPVNNDKLFFNAPVLIIVTSTNPLDGGLASSNMELMTDSLGLGTFFSGFFQTAAKDNKEILDFLKIKDTNIASCMVIGYPNVKYQRTTPRKEANIYWC